MTDLPVIDIAPLLAGDAEGTGRVAAAIGAACRSVGFFYITGHGVSDALMADVLDQSRRFFARPLAEKDAIRIGFDNRGYAGLDAETLNAEEAPDAKEAINLARADVADPASFGPEPSGLPGFDAVMRSYDGHMRLLCERLHAAFATDLNLPPDYFAGMIDRPMAVLRLLHYPPIESIGSGRVGAGVHTDYGNITILAQDSAGGLEVRTRGGEWIAAPPIAGTFVCNIGDCLMRWSNDVYVSTPHRVVAPAGRDRYSVAFFFDVNSDAMVECLPGCADADRPVRYPPISAGAYLKSRLDATYGFRVEGEATL